MTLFIFQEHLKVDRIQTGAWETIVIIWLTGLLGMDGRLLKIVCRNYCVYCFFELKLQCEMKPDVELYLYYQHIAVYCKLLFVCSRGDTVQYHGGLR